MSAEFTEKVCDAVLKRADCCCEACGRFTPHGVFHHRLPQEIGGTSHAIGTVENCLYVCTHCHQYIHSHPSESYLRGWLLHVTPESVKNVCEE